MADLDIEQLHSEAELLGDVYERMLANGHPLDAVDSLHDGARKTNKHIMRALSERSGGAMLERRLEVPYLAAFFSVKRQLQTKAAEAGCRLLTEQMTALTDLRTRLRTRGLGAAISDVAVRVGQRHGGFVPSADDEAEATWTYGPRYQRSTTTPDALEKNPRFEGGLQLVFRKKMRAALAAELQVYRKPVAAALRHRPGQPVPPHPQEVISLCAVLSVHPKFVEILEAYAESADRGSQLADSLVWEATYATAELYVDLLASPEHAWRYQPFVLLGVHELGLDDAPGFPQYAVALAEQISHRWYRVPLMVLGITISLVGLLFTGPAAGAGASGSLALAGIGVADFAVTAFSAADSYIEAREQEVAAVSSGFNIDKLAEPPSYFWTALGSAAALLCAIGVVLHGVRASQLLRGMRPGPETVIRRLDATGTRMRTSPPRRATSLASKQLENRLRQRPQRARFSDNEPGPTRPKHAYSPRGPDDPQSQRLAATGTDDTASAVPRQAPVNQPRPGPSTPGDAPADAFGSAGASPVNVMRAPFAHPPGASTIADTSFPMTAEQRSYSGSAPWKYSENQVGARLQEETGLPLLSQNSKAARQLGIKGKPADLPQVGRQVLIKEPIITHPGNPQPAWLERFGKVRTPEGSWKPDYLYATPRRLEVFEVTLDNRFQISPQEAGLVLRGTARRFGDAHKEIQLWKGEYLIRRYPHMDLVYNVQTIGQFPAEQLGPRIRAALDYLNKVRMEVHGTGSTQIIIRADRPYVYP